MGAATVTSEGREVGATTTAEEAEQKPMVATTANDRVKSLFIK
jgi:hypothetical protein